MAECKTEAEWAAEHDARSLANAEAIKTDPKRLAAAQKAAKRIVEDEAKYAKEANARTAALTKLANGQMAKPTARPEAKAAKPAAAKTKPAKRNGAKPKR